MLKAKLSFIKNGTYFCEEKKFLPIRVFTGSFKQFKRLSKNADVMEEIIDDGYGNIESTDMVNKEDFLIAAKEILEELSNAFYVNHKNILSLAYILLRKAVTQTDDFGDTLGMIKDGICNDLSEVANYDDDDPDSINFKFLHQCYPNLKLKIKD